MCPICLVNFQQSGRPFIRWNGTHTGIDGGRVSCGHPYHRDCIRDYVVTNHRCPVCRSEIPHVVSHNATTVARNTPLAAPVTAWATLPPAALLGRMMDMRVHDITGWIASANLWNEGGDGGSSRLFTVLVNHALRRAGVIVGEPGLKLDPCRAPPKRQNGGCLPSPRTVVSMCARF